MAVFKVMTFNILLSNHGRSPSRCIDMEAPDIVALQELSKTAAAVIEDRLSPRYPHRVLRPDPHGGGRGGGVLSRFPIKHEAPFLLSDGGNICQHLVITLPEGTIEFVNIHLKAPRLLLRPLRYDPHVREREAAELAKRLISVRQGHNTSLVVAGDFNMTPRSRAYQRLAGILDDAFLQAGRNPGFTFPNPTFINPLRHPLWPIPFPIVRIDYIFYSHDLRTREAHRGRGFDSDHCPVIATLGPR